MQPSKVHQLDLNLLKVFEQLYMQQNMSHAAEALNLTPSAVSHAVKRLRTQIGEPLFERRGAQMLPTPTCQRLAPLLLDNLARLRQILQQLGEFNPKTSQAHLRLGMHEALEPMLLAAIIQVLQQQAPGITLASLRLDRNEMPRLLAAGQLDMAIDVALPLKSPIFHQPLLTDGFCVLMGRQHALAQGYSASDYWQARHISVSHRPMATALEDWLMQQQGHSRKIGLYCQSYAGAAKVLSHSDLLLTAPQRLADLLLSDDLVQQPLQIDLPPIAIHLYWHANTEADPALQWCRQHIQQLF